ncbi:amidohydrolase [Pseudomarimonas salicorniae]|uniref:Amidohydrolase n=1 Tax=Pseudomarimonas salicorniae TaxID=2933270 RepID=A0ABT0GEB9_9GAMM|nr:amidohydrolase [Lysobacter sp. CAU 1642]MCK7592876.1 amidohydrolase [Lysobacter sp. CAU 1642]
MHLRPIAALLCLALTLPAAAVTRVENARIITMDPARPYAEAMVFDDGGTLLAVGDGATLRASHAEARRVDAGNAVIVPGLIDAHGHVLGHGLSLLRANLVGARSKDEIIERLRAFARDLPEGEWLLGRGWDQNLWPEREFPSAADLDAAFPDRPVWLERVDGHASWGNSAALAKLDRSLDGDWQVEGGEILRRDGKATGVFIDTAANLIEALVPPPDAAQLRRALDRSVQALVAAGLTGVHDAGVSEATLDLLRGMADDGALPLRIQAWADGDGTALAARCRDGGPYAHPGGRLAMRTVKLYSDGALGSRGALLKSDYSDAPGQRGLPVTSAEGLRAAMRKAKGCGLQVATHAIGDAGNRLVLDLYAEVLGEDAAADHRWRIEHAQIVSLSDIPRFARLGVIASMQPTHATSDMGWAEQRVGPLRIVGGYAWRSFRDAGVRLALGSDFPVEHIDPLAGLYAAITRQDAKGQPAGGWLPQEKLTAHEALRGFTLDAAFAAFDEARLGSLSPGKRADFVILDHSPIRDPASDLLQTAVIATWVDGQPVYQRPELRD